MGFNRRKMEDQRRHAAEKEAAGRRATDALVLKGAEASRWHADVKPLTTPDAKCWISGGRAARSCGL
jgi:hypothetical protein